MDDLDRKLMTLLESNPRMHFRELAARLGISRQAVHHRVQTLTETGVLKEAHAGISIPYLDAVPVAVFGTSRTSSIDKTLDRLGQSEFTGRVVVAGGSYLYVVGFLKKISELGRYVDFVKRAANMSEPTVGIYCLDDGLVPGYSVDGSGPRERKESFRELSSLDFKIIASLKDNARRPISEIAKVVGVTPKTVRRHMEAMISDGSMALTVPMDSQAGGDMFLIAHVVLKGGADKIEFGRRLLAKQYFLDQYIRTFSNIPGLLIWVFWSDEIDEVRNVLGEVGEEEDVMAVSLNFAYSERIYETWRDRLPEVLARSSERARPRQRDTELSKRRSRIAVREYGRR
jgi:DNA-binding Lrp family transcriptional regulator